ncbi:VPS52 protein, partial [Larus smithsonianus]|nr:VPS52 protein [Larus smithsonianus]
VHIQANLEDALVQEALKTGVDLRQYSKQVELELQEVERASIRDYIKESENIASLHNQITACDAILERMEQMLSAFQCDLSSISSEIRTLQEQSVAMNLRLKNRRAVRRQLGQLLDELVVPAAMISTILEAPVTEPEFLEQLQELNGKINSVKEQAFRETVACADVQHVLEKLKIKTGGVLGGGAGEGNGGTESWGGRGYPDIFSPGRFFYQFLLGNERVVAQELREQYVDTMSKIYLSYFKSYTSRLMKIQYEEVAEKDDLMGVEDTAKKDILELCPSLKNRNTVFTLGNRGSVIGAAELEGPIIVPHAAQKSDVRYPFESLFRSQHYALLDNSCREYLFLCDFFMVTGPSAQDLFNAVMGKTLAMFLKHMEAYVCDCYDSIAVFLCIHIVLRFKAIMAKRNIPAVEVENFVLRVAAEFSSRKEQLIFLINNYDMMLGVLMERAVEESKEVEGFQQLLSARTQEFIEEILSPPFGGMIAFVKEAEALLEKGQLERLRGEEARVTQLARGFSSTWKASVESLSQDVMRSFSNFKNGTGIIQGALTQLIQYYHRFHKVLAQPPLRSLPARAELINIHHLMVELKKHKPNF